jgi:intergrase/recombinase
MGDEFGPMMALIGVQAIACKRKEKDAFYACNKERVTTAEKMEACDKAIDELRRCLKVKANAIKMLAASACLLDSGE